jgi:transcriptional regulator with XRE-family HTH domain
MNQPAVPDFTWLEIGRRIRDWRLARGWSQQQLAEAAGLSQSGVVHLEKGDTNPQLDTLREIAAALGRTLRELMLGSPPDLTATASDLQQRVRRIADSNDKDAVSALEWGLWAAELLLERRSGHAGGVVSMREKEASAGAAVSPSVSHASGLELSTGNVQKRK